MNLDVNIDVIPNSNPTSPASEFLVEIPLDEEVPEPLPNTHCEVLAPVNHLESESSESDLSSYSFNYKSDSSAATNGPIYPYFHLWIIMISKIIQKMISIGWKCLKTMFGVFLLYHFLDQVVNSTSFQADENLRTFLMPYLMRQCGQL